jgi:hypothetical protein
MSLDQQAFETLCISRVKTDYFISALSIMAFSTAFFSFKKKKKKGFLALLNVLKEKKRCNICFFILFIYLFRAFLDPLNHSNFIIFNSRIIGIEFPLFEALLTLIHTHQHTIHPGWMICEQ